jgi:glycerol kinase
MDISVRRQESDIQQTSGVLADPQISNRILHWLADILQLTEEEQEDAGIYLGDQDSSEYPPDITIIKNSSHLDNKEKT